jgi:hypothetical protein
MIEATTITLSYSDHEDRIFLDCNDGTYLSRLVLTRRITRRLLSAFAELLEKSSIALTKAPADLRTEVIALEHLSAINQLQPKTAKEAGQSVSVLNNLGSLLVAKVDFHVTGQSFRLIFYSTVEAIVGLTLTRTDFHKVLAMLDQRATEAHWDIQGGTQWLSGVNPIVEPGRVAS